MFNNVWPTSGLLLALGLAAQMLAAEPTPSASLDGKVMGLSSDSYWVLKEIKQRNPGSLTESDANQLAEAIRKDGRLDSSEADLLAEMTQSQFRNIQVRPEASSESGAESVRTFPGVGKAKRVLLFVLHPVPDLSEEWSKSDHGWNTLVADYRSNPEREAKVLAFVTEEMAKKWELSHQGNGYKPLRDQIGKLYGLCHAPGADTNTGRTLLYKSVSQVDQTHHDFLPDFLYNWLLPGGSR